MLRISTRQVEILQAARVIPFIRIGKRSIRYHTERVIIALLRYEISETRVKHAPESYSVTEMTEMTDDDR